MNMRKIKVRYLWISVAISFVVAIGLILGVTQTSGNWTTFMIVLIAADFIYMTVAIQVASTRTFRYKAKPRKYPTIQYNISSVDLDSILKKKGYKSRNTQFGSIYLKVSGINAYRVSLIKDYDKYFNQEETQENIPVNKDLEKCKKFIGFEIFYTYDDDTLVKMPDFCIQGDYIYYSGFYINEGLLSCPNYIKPSEEFIPLYEQLKEDLELSNIEEINE